MKKSTPALPVFVRKPAVRRMLGGMSSQRIDELVREGTLPTPIQLGRRTCLFDVAELEGMIVAPDDRADLHLVCSEIAGLMTPFN